MGDCLAPGDWPVVRGLAVGLTRRQGIRRAVLGHVYDGAAVPVSCEGGVVRLRAARTGFQPRHRFRLLFGGGVKKGYVHGVTADERPCLADKPVSIEDLHATIFTAMGISPKTEYSIEGRPFYATKDGVGKAVRDVLA